MSYVRSKVARAVVDLATHHGPIEARIKAVFERHFFGRALRFQAEADLERELDVLVDRWMSIRQLRSTYASRVRAAGIATELCNLASRYPMGESLSRL